MIDNLFFNVFRNKYIRSIIVRYLCSYNHIDYYFYFNQQIEQKLIKQQKYQYKNNNNNKNSNKNNNKNNNDFEEYQIYFDKIIEIKNELKIKKYIEINELEWIVKNKKFSLLYDKLIMYKKIMKKQIINENSNNFKIKITEDSIYQFFEFNNNFKLFKLFYKLYFIEENHGEYYCKTNTRIIQKAVQSGNIEIVKFLVENGFKYDGDSLRFASSYGYFDILKWLNQTDPTIELDENIINFARGDPIQYEYFNELGKPVIGIRNVGLEIIQYLKSVKPNLIFSQDAIDYSCISGNVDMVDWFYKNANLKCTLFGVEGAIIGNHLKLLKYLLLKKSSDINMADLNSSFSIDESIKNGNIEIVKYIYEKYSKKWSIRGIENSVKKNHFEILKYILSIELNNENSIIKNPNLNYSILDSAFCGGDLNILEYLIKNNFNNSFKSLLNATKFNHDLNVLKLLLNNNNLILNFSQFNFLQAIQNSVFNKNLDSINYLIEIKNNLYNNNNNNNTSSTLEINEFLKMIDRCIITKDLVILKILIEKLNIQFNYRKDLILSNAALNNCLEIIEYLLSLSNFNFKILPTTILMSGNITIAKLLYNYYCLNDHNNNNNKLPIKLSFNINHNKILNNLNLIKYHFFRNDWNFINEDEIIKFASVPNNVEVLKFLKNINSNHYGKEYKFSTKVLSKACFSNSIENVIFINENLNKETVDQFPVIDSSVDNLEITKYLHYQTIINNYKNWCTTKSIDTAAELNNFNTVLFLLENRNEGYSTDVFTSKTIHHSILKLLNSFKHLLKK
ncbi:hypothetical protein ACTFIW_008159 [Dictyostelium discoideum]